MSKDQNLADNMEVFENKPVPGEDKENVITVSRTDDNIEVKAKVESDIEEQKHLENGEIKDKDLEQENMVSGSVENSDQEDDEDDELDSDDEDTRSLSIMEIRRRNQLKMESIVSNVLGSAKAKLTKLAESLERKKPERRKRKRNDSNDEQTRTVIRQMMPVRRSMRQVERKYYSEGVDDPERLGILKKLENYMRLNSDFQLPSEDSYETDFRGFKQNEIKRSLYIEQNKRRHLRRAHYRNTRDVPVPAMAVSDITDDVLSRVVTQVSAKVYSTTGSTCHQCRQKTTDTKTFCRSGKCTGVRGQFCGVCLLNRYGENIVDALLNESWACPPCRNVCNCSICRNRKGLPPTGILTPLALGKGFASVKEYLEEAEKDLEIVDY